MRSCADILGLMRGLVGHLHPKLPIRLNAVSPSWTDTGIVPRTFFESLGQPVQSPEIVARSIALLIAPRPVNLFCQRKIQGRRRIYAEPCSRDVECRWAGLVGGGLSKMTGYYEAQKTKQAQT